MFKQELRDQPALTILSQDKPCHNCVIDFVFTTERINWEDKPSIHLRFTLLYIIHLKEREQTELQHLWFNPMAMIGVVFFIKTYMKHKNECKNMTQKKDLKWKTNLFG